MTAETKRSHVDAWIDNSAKHNLTRELALARMARKAYRTEPYKGAAELLAQAHEECAAVWQDVLNREGPSRPAASQGFTFEVVSEYAGEQGHLGGGDLRAHGTFDSPAAAFEWIAGHRGEFDYRDVRVEVRRP